MDSDPPQHRRNQTIPQAIPLQDLSRPPESEHSFATGFTHRRTLSDRGRDFLARAGSTARPNGQYAALRDHASDSPERHPTNAIRRPQVARTLSESSEDVDQSQHSPLVDRSRFQEAMGFAGLSVEGHPSQFPFEASSLPHRPHALGNMLGNNDSELSLEDVSLSGAREDSPSSDNDRAPLADRRNIQPIAGAPVPSTPPSAQRRNRLSTHTVRFATPNTTSPQSRLGDDLGAIELGVRTTESGRNRSGSVHRSLSPSSATSPLTRASTMVRKMSQRVVNLSNEPEVIAQEMRERARERESDSQNSTAPSNLDHDGARSPSEKAPKQDTVHVEPAADDWTRIANPLKGNSLGIFPPDSKLRTALCDFMVNPLVEPCILILIVIQTVLLAVDAAPNWYQHPRSRAWDSSWIDFTLLGLFIVYTIELGIRIVVSGFIINPIEYSTINRQIGLKEAVMTKANSLFALHREPSVRASHPDSKQGPQASLFRAFTSNQGFDAYAKDSRHAARVRLAHRAFLRHSFNRVDFLAVVSYWINFAFSVSGVEKSEHLHAFGFLSCLRILRLLSLTSGTSVILRSMKKAAPLLLNVALLIGFFWLLFAIVGVQSFKSSLRRNCVWVDPTTQNPRSNYTTNAIGNFQFCGGSLDAAGNKHPWSYANGESSNDTKGYMCPPNSYCVSANNPYNGTVSFDNIFQSLQQVFVIMTSNTYSDILYYLTDSDYLIAALYFAVGIVILTFWLMNLLIAVITSSFQVIREESHSSAFGTDETKEDGQENQSTSPRKSTLLSLYDKSYWFWISVIAFGLICQCLRSAEMSNTRKHLIDTVETVVTLVLLLEILIRFAADWRHFFKSKKNMVDLFIAVVTTVIQLPAIHSSGQPYAWLTLFQVVRIYRVVIAVPWTRDLILLVLGRVSGLLNLILFVFLLTFFGAIFASQLFRGELPEEDSNGNPIKVTFYTIFNCFLGMYQVLSSENWTVLMYNVTSYDAGFRTGWIGAIFFILWFILGYFIVLNMFIAVIQENFDVSEDEKRLQQVKAFLQQKELGGSSHGTLSLSAMFKLKSITGRRQDPLDYGPAMTEMLLKDAVVRDFLDENGEPLERHVNGDTLPNGSTFLAKKPPHNFAVSWWRKLKGWVWDHEPNPFYHRFKFSRAYEELDPRAMAREAVSAAERRKKAQREYLRRHPTYNVSLFLFSPRNPLRRLCQKMVGPGRGHDRIEGSAPSPIVWYAFSAILYAAIVAMVLLACVTTPLYQRNYWSNHEYSIRNWFVFTDLAFAAVFTFEAIIRVIADGLFFTPHAYFRSSWGIIDGVVLITLWINCVTSLYNEGAVSRAVGAFKALRALRLLNVSDSARDTFHSVIVRGGWKVLSAAFVSLSLLIPFAIYGLNLFNGQMLACNDGNSNIFDLNDCVGEYMSSPNNWDVLAPRQVSNPWYNFDNFGDSLFILFQIVSQEGWVDVMWSAQSITGFFTQPAPFSRQGNAVFFVVFNLLGAVFVLTLFVSVFMRNYTEQTGVAFLTTDQRSWLELRKLLRQVSPSKRPPSIETRETWEQWCYRRAVRKTGSWQRFFTWVLVFHLVLLCLEFYPEPVWWQYLRDYIFLLLILFYISNMLIRIIGLTWQRFRKSSWDLYSLVAIPGAFITMIMHLSKFDDRNYSQISKLFLVSVVLLLIPRNNQLDQLFKTAAASLTAIGNLLATWFVLFLVYAIAFTQTFGLTRFNSNESDNINFRDVPKALILLFRMSTGEGWDQLMQDFATILPPFCNTSSNFLDNDCGSSEWAKTLFISWNVLSMYIFVNMFVSLIYESFSYVYQRSSGLAVISRKEIRRFKQAWAEFDPDGTGYISKAAFPRFLGELSGVFEMRVYPDEYSVSSLKTSLRTRRSSKRYGSGLPAEAAPIDGAAESDENVDIARLNERLDDLPIEEIQARRMRLNVFYEEVMISLDPDRGIGFTSLLMILAHYKVINDNKSLRLEEFLRRRARLQRVEEAVRRSIVIGFFDTLYWRRRFRQHQEKQRAGRITELPKLQVPEILVEGEGSEPSSPVTPGVLPSGNPPERPALSLQIPDNAAGSSTGTDAGGNRAPSTDSTAPSGLRNRADSIQISPAQHHRRNSTKDGLSPMSQPPPRGRSGSQGPGSSLSPSMAEREAGVPLTYDFAAALGVPPPIPRRSSDDPSVKRPSVEVNTEYLRRSSSDRHHVQGEHLNVPPADELDPGLDGPGAGSRSRAGSNVSARDVLSVLDNSAWGESIRRSFTHGHGGHGRSASRGGSVSFSSSSGGTARPGRRSTGHSRSFSRGGSSVGGSSNGSRELRNSRSLTVGGGGGGASSSGGAARHSRCGSRQGGSRGSAGSVGMGGASGASGPGGLGDTEEGPSGSTRYE